MAGIGHLARRFLGSLRPGGPAPADAGWAQAQLGPGEQALWARMSGPDRRHAAGVARRVEAALGERATRPVLAAALLHDVGKVASGLRTPGRVLATGLAAVRGPESAHRWAARRGFRGRVGRYLLHADLGAQMLEAAGSDRLTVAWARDHHRRETEWAVPVEVGTALKAADDD